MTHVDPPDRADRQGYEIVKIQDGCGRLSEKNQNTLIRFPFYLMKPQMLESKSGISLS